MTQMSEHYELLNYENFGNFLDIFFFNFLQWFT
jgi:hypothetical protein